MEKYPTEKQLCAIEDWDVSSTTKVNKLWEFIKPLWHWEHYFQEEPDRYVLHTGGWSGNEEIIMAMKCNTIFWSLYWYSLRRGGHYVFLKPRKKKNPAFNYNVYQTWLLPEKNCT